MDRRVYQNPDEEMGGEADLRLPYDLSELAEI